MRNLEFRGIDIATGLWVYGGIDIQRDTPIIINHGVKYFVDAKTVGQFTGLHDKNGTKIFEGDYLKSYHYTDSEGFDHFITHTVEWSERLSGWYMVGEDDQGDGDGSLQAWVYIKSSSSIEIIGNIHEDK